MPLLPGNHPDIISHNIHEMIQAGHPHNQAVAAALHNAGMRKSKKAKKMIDNHNQISEKTNFTSGTSGPGGASGAAGGY